jgi:hypothetical protein
MIWLIFAALAWGFFHFDVDNSHAPIDITGKRLTWPRYIEGFLIFGAGNVFIVYALIHGLTQIGVLR